MNTQNKNNYKSTRRYKHHDYNDGTYFITICTKNRKHYFGEVSNQKVRLSKIGIFTNDVIRNLNKYHPDIEIPTYIIMPNHVHLIIHIEQNTITRTRESTKNYSTNNENHFQIMSQKSAARLPTVIRSIKSFVTRHAKENNITFSWQPRFHDHIIRNNIEYRNITRYIIENPMRW